MDKHLADGPMTKHCPMTKMLSIHWFLEPSTVHFSDPSNSSAGFSTQHALAGIQFHPIITLAQSRTEDILINKQLHCGKFNSVLHN